MSKVLCTFSGPNGDILWSLPTVKAIAVMLGEKSVDMAIMPYYDALLPLLNYQSYISNAFVVKDWLRLHSNYGDQPWLPPATAWKDYERVFHLTYRAHPGLGGKRLPLIDFTADQQGIKLANPLPFLDVPNVDVISPHVAYAFNKMYDPQKQQFLANLKSIVGVALIDVTEYPWLEAASVIKSAIGFVGCRSGNYVLAHGVGQHNIYIYEPHPSRNAHGHLGDVFGCPYAHEITAPWLAPPNVCANVCAAQIVDWETSTKKEAYA